MADMNFTLKINEASKFNSGEFEGWGTSLCWWANRVGYNKNLINQAVEKFYSPKGLDLNIGRYNIGGGDHVKETFHTPYYIDSSNLKVIYDLRTSGLKPEYFGTGMSISSVSNISSATYTKSDSDFGITKGATVGNIEAVNYINKLDEPTAYGGNLRYNNINVTNSGLYTVKFLLTATDTNDRDLAIRVNNISKYSIDTDTVNNNIIATNGTTHIYLVTFDGVYLSQGVNFIDVGSNSNWGLDVIRMAVIRSKDNGYYRDWMDVPPNKKADIYDCLDHRQSIKTGTSMGNFFLGDLQEATYSKSDANFGIQAGETVKKLYAFNYINKLDDSAGAGGNATFNVDVKEASKYDILLMLTLEGTNNRDMAIKVNGTKYSVNTNTINSNVIASTSNRKLYIAPFYDIYLNKGINEITIGGNTGWGLDFVKMCVVKTASYGVLPGNDDFLHNSHINRSDSAIPGYCTDVAKINTNNHSIDWYNEHYTRVDEECGYAWNYDWDADRHQMNILKAIAKYRGNDFIAEAFSNSPPYFMTNSGCSSGATNSSQNNLRDNAYNAFAKYLADVIAHINNEDNRIKFTSATGMNEPYTNYWGANSNKQEGCHFDQGYSQSRVIKALNWNLKDKGVNDCIVSGTDETSIDVAISSYNALDQYAKETISRIDTHTYDGSDRVGLRQLAENEGKNLWMSEVDGDFTHGTNAGEMSAALGLAHRIIEDLTWMKPSAWILWDIIDMHCDTGNVHDGNDFSWLNTSGGYWGLTACNHDDEYIWCLKKYYAFGQFTRYIRPGYTIFPIDWNSLGAYDSKNNKVVIVAMNTEASDKSAWFSFEQFGTMNTTNITAIRTSGALDGGENWADVSSSCNIWLEKDSKWFTADLKANSITTFIVDNVKLESPSDLSTQVIMYKRKKQLTPVSGTPTTGQYSVTITNTINCTARLESDHKTISLLSATSNDGKINISINVENLQTYNKVIRVANMVSTSTVRTAFSQAQQLSDKFNWLVKSGTSSSNMELTADAYNVITKNINLTADNINLEGYTTINGGFSVDARGNMSCVNANVIGTITGSTISGSVIKSGTDYNPNKLNITGLKMENDTIYSYGTKNNGMYGVTKISGGTINIGNGADGAGLNWSTHISPSDISLFKQGSTGYFYVGTTNAPGSGYSTTTTTIDTTTINIGSKDETTAFKVDYNDHCEFGNNYFTRGSLTINQLSQGAAKGTQTYLSGTTISATNIYQNGSSVSGSDIILKDNIKEYEDSALDIINKTKVYSFNRILANPDKTEIGFLAQQVPDIFVFDKGEFTAEELEGLTAQEKQQLLDKKTKERRTVLENKKLDEIADKVASFYDLSDEQAEEQISQIIDEYKNIEYEVPISTINQNNIIAIMFKAIQELKAELDEIKKTL